MNHINLYEKIEEVKENIRTINPEITDELLDLLYEYISVCLHERSKSLTIQDCSYNNSLSYCKSPCSYCISPQTLC